MNLDENQGEAAHVETVGDLEPNNPVNVVKVDFPLQVPPGTAYEGQNAADNAQLLEDKKAASKRTVKSSPKTKKTVAKLVAAVIKEADQKPPKEPKPPKERYSVTVYFEGEEKEYVENVIKARIESGLSTDKAHFGRQAIDFAINYNSEMKAKVFSVPDQPKILLKNGIFEKRGRK